jgi:hypothetical protein
VDIAIGDLTQKVMQLRRHAIVVAADPRAEGAQVDQEAEGVAITLGFAGHSWELSTGRTK